MMTTNTFGKKNNNKNTFFISSKPNYSKILDNIIASDIIKKNDYLFKTAKNDYLDDLLFNAKPTKDIELEKAINFLANYKTMKSIYTLPFKLNTLYYLPDKTPIIFFDDEIQIGHDSYGYNDFTNYAYISKLAPSKKKIIIDIYNASGISININLK